MVAALFACHAVFAQDGGEIVKRVDDHYNRLASLKSGFVEHYTGLGLDRTEMGTLLLRKPGRMRWSYEDPAGKVFVLDGRFAYSYAPGDVQAQRVPAKQLDDVRSPLRLLLGHTKLQKELDELNVMPEGDGFRITGVPHGMQARVRQLMVLVSSAGLIRGLRLEETDGAVTEFTFRQMQENVALPDSDFVFVAPRGVTVVNGLPPI